MKNKCLFLDRDGVINYDLGYVYLVKDFKFREEIFKICEYAQNNFYKIIVVTNQAGIGRGYFTVDDFLRINQYMLQSFKQRNIFIDDVYFCPFHPKNGKGKYLKDSEDRKPNPGMILKAVKNFNLDIKRSIMIGDKDSDRQAALRAGLTNYIDANQIDWKKKSIEFIMKN